MKRSLRSIYLTRKNRLKCHSGSIGRDCLRAAALLAVILFMTAGLIYVFNYAISAPYFVIKATSVRGCRELTEKEVLALAALKSSQTIFSVNMEAMARRIASQPWVKNVAIGREFPNRLVFEVQERTALALCRRGEDLYLFDQDGVFFKKLEAGDEVDVPVLTGYYQGEQLNKELFDETMLLMKILAVSKSFPALNAVSEINAGDVSGFSLYTENGFCLKLGFGNYENKLKRLLPVITALNKKDMKEGLLNIDLRDTSKIYVERRGVVEPKEQRRIKKGLST
jgi:cell division protein FtsQ